MLTLKKYDSFLANKAVVESVNQATLIKLLKSDQLWMSWHASYWQSQINSQFFKNEVEQLTKYKNRYNEDVEGHLISFKQNSGWGRVFPTGGLSLTSMRRTVRHTLAEEAYYDLDMVNCQPNIIYHALKSNGKPIPKNLEMYVTMRDEILKYHVEYFQLDRWRVKQLFISLFFMGTFFGFKKRLENEKINLTMEEPPFIRALSKELQDVGKSLKELNPDLYRSAQQKRKDPFDKEPNKNMRTFLSLWCQTYEFMIVDKVIEHLHNTTSLLQGKKQDMLYCSYEFDGIKLLKSNVHAYEGGIEGVLSTINTFVESTFRMPLKFEAKPMDEILNLENVSLEDVDLQDVDKDIKALITDMKTAMQSHKFSIDIIAKQCGDNYIYSREESEWYTYSEVKNNWEKSNYNLMFEYQNVLMKHFDDQCPESYKTNIEYNELKLQFLRTTGKAGFFSGIEKLSKTYLSKDSVRYDTQPFLLNFNNGVYDITTNTFRQRTKDDFLSMCCGYDFTLYEEGQWPTEQEVYKEEIMDILRKIHPDEKVLEFFLYCLASGTIGQNFEKFFILNGSGRNGKSLINSVMKLCLGAYYGECPTSVLIESPKNKSSGEANSTIASLDKLRYVVTSEPPKSIPIQNSVIKLLTGGGSIQARQIYQKARSMELTLSLFLETNSRPCLAESANTAEYERLYDIYFGSSFVSDKNKLSNEKHIYLKDAKLKEPGYWKERRIAFMNILLGYSHRLYKNGLNLNEFCPPQIIQRTEEYCNASFLAHQLFTEYYQRFSDDEIKELAEKMPREWNQEQSIPSIVSYLRSSEAWYSQPAYIRNKRENNAANMKEFFMTNVIYDKYKVERRNRVFVLQNYRRKLEEKDLGMSQPNDTDNSTDFDLLSEDNSFLGEEYINEDV